MSLFVVCTLMMATQMPMCSEPMAEEDAAKEAAALNVRAQEPDPDGPKHTAWMVFPASDLKR